MEQFLAAQTQLLTNMANTIANMQAQMNQAPPLPPPPARDRHREFMSHKPPSFSHSPDPLQADDWIKMVEKMLNVIQCTDREKVLYTSDRLEGTVADWWDAYTAAHDTPQHHHLAGVQEQVQGATHTQRSDEAQEARVPCTETRSNICE
jgi:hypothetical protein